MRRANAWIRRIDRGGLSDLDHDGTVAARSAEPRRPVRHRRVDRTGPNRPKHEWGMATGKVQLLMTRWSSDVCFEETARVYGHLMPLITTLLRRYGNAGAVANAQGEVELSRFGPPSRLLTDRLAPRRPASPPPAA